MEVSFKCNKCNGELVLEENGTNVIRELDPYSIGTKDVIKKKTKATCNNCGKVDEDYFIYPQILLN